LKFIRFAVLVFLAASCTTAVFSQSPIPTGPLKARLQPVVSGLSGTLTGNTANSRRQFIPIDMSPLGDGRQLVFTLGGHVRLLQANGTLAAGAYLDTFNNVSSPLPGDLNFRDIGNTGIAAHPGFLNPQSRGHGRFYTLTAELPDIFPTDFDDGVSSSMDSVVTEWTVAPSAINSATQLSLGTNVSKREILRSARPGIIHTLIDIAFTNDEYLVVPSGDGGGNAFPNTNGSAFGQDRFTNAQDPTNIMGSVLRIDPLSLPGDTRPVGGRNGQYRLHPQNWGLATGDPDIPGETMAYGLRSPYRVTVDRQTNEVYIGDVGESSREEVNRVFNGGNYGWGAYEGSQLVRPGLAPGTGEPPHTPPMFELFHNLSGQSESVNVVGGFVYRGSQIPALQGKYVFADTGENEFTQPTNVVELYYGNPATSAISTRDDLFKLQIELPAGLNMPDRIWSIAEDSVGELYLLVGPSRGDLFVVGAGETDGGVYKLVAPTGAPNNLAGDINQDGMVDQNDILALKAGWYTTGHATPFRQYTHGDLNFDGITNLLDLYLLHDALLAVGHSSGISELTARVPEPSGIVLVILAASGIYAGYGCHRLTQRL
jgi:glucose/arabinose dehydrogenase